ncbi:MAG: Phosphinothricin N-acetyltransferase [Firmicutes bacterium ADurb.Bin354]|nr:MAG: Phosphinothricin N-acetyltransferase [Firmicutes bacterium ADurb.Bin354]
MKTMSDEFKIRDVEEKDAARLVEIYSHYITDTAVSFEYTVPTVEEFAERIRKIKAKYPYLVCEKNGVVLGYVYAGRYNPREAYNWTVTTSIYVDKDCHRQGVGAMLYDALEERLKEAGIVNLLAGIAYCETEDEYLTHDSVKFHLKSGYEQVARIKTVGKKFNRWYDLLWMQKKI